MRETLRQIPAEQRLQFLDALAFGRQKFTRIALGQQINRPLLFSGFRMVNVLPSDVTSASMKLLHTMTGPIARGRLRITLSVINAGPWLPMLIAAESTESTIVFA